jgi:hypothetical protein
MATQQTSTVQAVALAASGGLAGGLAKTTVAPLERVKLLLQTGETATVTTSLVQVVRHEGILALWRGNTVNVREWSSDPRTSPRNALIAPHCR